MNTKTLKDLADNALAIQDACNLSGVVHSFSETMTRLRELSGSMVSTTMLNKHPIAVLYSSKIASLTGSENGMEFAHAYEEVKKLVKE